MASPISEPLRIALVAEGPTDRIVIEAALSAMLCERPFVLTQLQPEASEAFGPFGGGWIGVYRWCHQSALRGGGRVSGDPLFVNYDLLIAHLDADVAEHSYADGTIEAPNTDLPLPCARACPPPSATTNALRSVLLSWCGESDTPRAVVICMPSKSTEAWILAALFPDDQAVNAGVGGVECWPDPEGRLAQQPVRRRIRKSQRDYLGKRDALCAAWPHLAVTLDEAQRFQREFVAAI